MSVHSNIRAAARALVIATAGLPAAKAWEGMAFSPSSVAFLAEALVPVGSVPVATGSAGQIAHTIAINLTLSFPPGKGTAEIDAAAEALMQAFRPGSWLVYGGQSGLIRQCERSSLRQEPDWISCTVTATVIAYTST